MIVTKPNNRRTKDFGVRKMTDAEKERQRIRVMASDQRVLAERGRMTVGLFLKSFFGPVGH